MLAGFVFVGYNAVLDFGFALTSVVWLGLGRFGLWFCLWVRRWFASAWTTSFLCLRFGCVCGGCDAFGCGWFGIVAMWCCGFDVVGWWVWWWKFSGVLMGFLGLWALSRFSDFLWYCNAI